LYVTFGMNDDLDPKLEFLPGRKLHKDVELRIRQYIDSNRLAKGARLPTEAEFCRLFNVSRSTVRHALDLLEMAGVVTRVQGSGTFLSRTDPSQNAKEIVKPVPIRAANNTIGVVLSYSSEVDIMQTAILRGIEHAVKSRGYNLLFGRTDDWDEAGELRAIDNLYRIGVMGFVILTISNQTSTAGVRMLVENKVPVVLVDRYLSDLDTSYVVADNYAGSYTATEHFILMGYRQPLFVIDSEKGEISEQLLTTSIRDRYAGFSQALRDYGLTAYARPPLIADKTDQDSIRRLLMTPHVDKDRPLALVAVHDYLAAGMVNTAAQMGLHPPADFAIIGFDDLPFASSLSVPLTTIIQPRYDIGFRAGHMLADKIAGDTIRNEKVSLLVSLVVRESCGARRQVRRLFENANLGPGHFAP
jgi:GntR family transcriptional regulator of arabinose operon